jgi:hypothetical protein
MKKMGDVNFEEDSIGISRPLYLLVDAVFELQSHGFIWRQVRLPPVPPSSSEKCRKNNIFVVRFGTQGLKQVQEVIPLKGGGERGLGSERWTTEIGTCIPRSFVYDLGVSG